MVSNSRYLEYVRENSRKNKYLFCDFEEKKNKNTSNNKFLK